MEGSTDSGAWETYRMGPGTSPNLLTCWEIQGHRFNFRFRKYTPTSPPNPSTKIWKWWQPKVSQLKANFNCRYGRGNSQTRFYESLILCFWYFLLLQFLMSFYQLQFLILLKYSVGGIFLSISYLLEKCKRTCQTFMFLNNLPLWK